MKMAKVEGKKVSLKVRLPLRDQNDQYLLCGMKHDVNHHEPKEIFC